MFYSSKFLIFYVGILLFTTTRGESDSSAIVLTENAGLHCEGVLISRDYVLTALRCALNNNLPQVTLSKDGHKSLAQTEEVKLHPDNTSLALLKLALNVSDYELIKLPSTSDAKKSFVGQNSAIFQRPASYSGAEFGNVTILQGSLVETSKCTVPEDLKDKVLCFENQSPSEDPTNCVYKTGSVLISNNVLVGISLDPNAACQKTSVAFNVAKYIDWIKDNSDVPSSGIFITVNLFLMFMSSSILLL